MKIAGRTFIISGGSSGLGLATTLHLISKGASVSILDINPPPDSSGLPKTKHLFTETDVTSSTSIAAAIQATTSWIDEEQRPRAPLGGVIACAGIGNPELIFPKGKDGKGGGLRSLDRFDKVISVNLRGTVDLVRQTLPVLAAVEPEEGEYGDGERGVVVLVSSVAAYEGQVGQVAYSASKGAIASIALPMARELARFGIRAVGVAPGVFESGMTLRGGIGKGAVAPPGMVEFPKRMGKGEEFASLIGQFLENSMLNGTVVRLDAGARFPATLPRMGKL